MQRPAIHERFLPLQCHASSKHGFKPRLLEASGIVFHYFSGRYAFPEDRFNLEKCWQLFRDLNFNPDERVYNIYDGPRVAASAHFLIGRESEIWQLVPLEFVAWHAGPSHFDGRDNCNDFMIGVELVGQAGVQFTDNQYSAATALSRWLMTHYKFPVSRLAGHDQVARPHGRKVDPGPLFDWGRLFSGVMRAA